MSIRVGIYGYGNLGRGIENAIRQNPDMGEGEETFDFPPISAGLLV